MIKAMKYNFSDYKSKFDFAIHVMADMVITFKSSPLIRDRALMIIRNVPERDKLAEATAIFDYVRYNVKFRGDVFEVETLQTPIQTLTFMAGDCDDQVTLLNSLLESIGIPTRFAVIAQQDRSTWNHVYSQVYINGSWMDADTVRNVEFGIGPDDFKRRKFYEYD